MKFSATSLLSFLFMASVVDASFEQFQKEVRMKQDFMKAMHSKPTVSAATNLGKAEKLRKLNENLIMASRKLSRKMQEEEGEEGEYQYGDDANLYFDEEGNLYYQGQDGQYYTSEGELVEPNEYGMYPWEDNVPFDLSSRSFKYAGCSAIKTYDVDRAEDTGNPMVIDTYAVFRLCPSNKCNPYSITGCGKNYGEYAVEMKTYLSFLLEYYNERYDEYCSYCMGCDWDAQAQKKQDLKLCRQSMSQEEFYNLQQMHQQAYQDFVSANGEKAAKNYFSNGDSPYNNGEGFSNYDGMYYNGASGNQNGQYQNFNQGNANNGNGDVNYYQQYQQYNQQYQYDQQYNNAANDEAEDANDGGRRLDAYDQCQVFLQTMQGMYTYNGQGNYYGADQQGEDDMANGYYYNQQAGAAGYYNQQQNYYDEDNNFNENAYQSGQSYANGQDSNFQYNDAAMGAYWYSMDCCMDGSICDKCEIEMERVYGYCDDYICGDYYDHCSSYYSNLRMRGYNPYEAYAEKMEAAQEYAEQQAEENGGYDYTASNWYTFNVYDGQWNQDMYEYQNYQQNAEGEEQNQYGNYYGVDNGFDLSEFLECSEYVNAYGKTYYIGPHCGDDRFTISLGIFSDANCLEYIGETVSLSDVLGYQYSDDDLFKFPKECISCAGVVDYMSEEYQEYYNELHTDEYNQKYGEYEGEYGQYGGRYGDYATAPDSDADTAMAICSTLYTVSAQCNVKIESHDQIARTMTSSELLDEQNTCTFINNIMYGSYDESGEITLKPDTFDFADWRNPKQYKKVRLPAGQAVLLSLSIIFFLGMVGAVIAHHRMIRRNKSPWVPNRPPPSSPLDHKQSHIVLERDQSGVPGDYKPPAVDNAPMI